MALEAAHQLSENNTDSICLVNVQFQRAIPLSVFSQAETAVEAQFIAREIDGIRDYAFDIYFQSLPEVDSWTKQCCGYIKMANTLQRPSFDFSDRSHDDTLMSQVQILEPTIGTGLDHLKLYSEGSSGEFKSMEDDVERYFIDPTVLNSILRLPPISVWGRGLPTEYRISSLASLTLSFQSKCSERGRFTTRVGPSEAYSIECNSEIHHLKNIVSLKRVRYQATKAIFQRPSLSSLFFKPGLLPDITTLSAVQPMSIVRCAELLTHKWPACDIRINEIPERCTISVIEAFGANLPDARSRFRSIECSSLPPEAMTDHVLLADVSDTGSKYHLIISDDVAWAAQVNDRLYPGGFLCCSKAQIEDLKSDQTNSFEAVCEITGLDPDSWILLRKVLSPVSASTGRRIIMFTTELRLPPLSAIGKIEYVPLEPQSVAHFCELNNNTRFDALVIDSPKKAIITSWTGNELMPWLQTLLKFADSILWVTQNHHKNPFANVAGSLLRTLQLEQPSLKVSWLKVNEMMNENHSLLASQVEQAYIRMIGREDELVHKVTGSEREILRYVPDDCLSAYTGLALPRKLQCSLGNSDYSLEFVTPGEPTIFSYKSSETPSLSDHTVEICVEASVLDSEDLRMYNSEASTEVHAASSGIFFAGKISKSQNPKFPLDSHTVCWCPDHLHRKRLITQVKYLSCYPNSMQPSQAASRYAALAVASCVVDGAARARRAETFILDVKGPLLNAITQVCKNFGASVLDSHSGSKADFIVMSKLSTGICVNGREIDLAGYLHSDHGREMLHRVWQNSRDLQLEIKEYDISQYQDGFKNAETPFSTVLLHRNATKVLYHVPVYKKLAPMLTSHAHYVVVGGLGGLGRFICSWMSEKGARHITVISRSGASTQESRDALSAMNTSGICVQSVKADACDRQAVSSILSRLRRELPIRGIINLAMVLGDAPMTTMTAEEWDRVLRVKIDSSWILHEETMQDRLDFFILFSSIASVLGNRNQGNYNVANTALNALADYRQSLDLPGISVALGAMSKSLVLLTAWYMVQRADEKCYGKADIAALADMGVLYNISQANMLQTLTRSGLTHLTQYHLGKIMEAAILESPRRDRSLLLTGLNMFEREPTGRLVGRTEPLMWTDWSEFGHLLQYQISTHEGEIEMTKATLQDQVAAMRNKGDSEQMKDVIRHAFLTFLSQLLGFGADTFDPSQALNMYGIDSLSGVSCQYWFHKGISTAESRHGLSSYD